MASDAINPDRFIAAFQFCVGLRPAVLRRVFRIGEPTSSHGAIQNLIRAGWWELGLLGAAAVAIIGLKGLVTSPPGWFWPVVFVALLIPAGAAALTVAGEMAAAISLRLRERKLSPRTGKFLIDNDVLVGVLVVAGLIVLAIVLVMFRAV